MGEHAAQQLVTVWAPESTLDQKVSLSPEQIAAVIEYSLREPFQTAAGAYQRRADDVLRELQSAQRRTDGSELGDREIRGITHEGLVRLEHFVHRQCASRDSWKLELGGGPAISAWAASQYWQSPEDPVYFVGNLARLPDGIASQGIFRYSQIVGPDSPRTLALESRSGKFKVMIPYEKGRRLEDVDWEAFAGRLGALGQDAHLIVALGGLNKGSPRTYDRFVSRIREAVDEPTFFVGTNSFRGCTSDEIAEYLRMINMSAGARILSFNEAELQQAYTALGGGNARTCAEMLLELDSLCLKKGITPAIPQAKICHAPEGAILYGNGTRTAKNLQEELQRSVDATSYRYETGTIPRADDIPLLSDGYETRRQLEQFIDRFGSPHELPQRGIISAIAPHIDNPAGSTTGLGATFDGLLLSYLGKHVAGRRQLLKPK